MCDHKFSLKKEVTYIIHDAPVRPLSILIDQQM